MLREPPRVGGRGDVHLHRQRLSSSAGDLVDGRLGRRGAQVADDHACALGREPLRDRLTDARAAAGYQRYPTLEPHQCRVAIAAPIQPSDSRRMRP